MGIVYIHGPSVYTKTDGHSNMYTSKVLSCIQKFEEVLLLQCKCQYYVRSQNQRRLYVRDTFFEGHKRKSKWRAIGYACEVCKEIRMDGAAAIWRPELPKENS